MSNRLRTSGDDDDRGSAAAASPPGGTGDLGMVIFIAMLSTFFLASIVIYLLMRRMHPWPPPGFPALPQTLWLSTLDILFTSVTVQGAVLAVRRGDTVGLKRNLAATLALALGFLGLQTYAWYTVWKQVSAIAGLSASYTTMFYFITGLHAAHVVGGIVPLVIVTIRAYRGAYGRRKTAAIRYTALYWHFLDVAWCAIFFVVFLL